MKEKLLFTLIMSGCMAFTMSGIMTYLNLGVTPNFVSKWMQSFIIAYGVAFPLVLIISPIIGKLVRK